MTILPLVSSPNGNSRLAAGLAAILISALLHGGVLFWYANHPAPQRYTGAVPLPTIAMELLGAHPPAGNQAAVTPPKPLPLLETRKNAPELKKKINPEPLSRETNLNRIKKPKAETADEFTKPPIDATKENLQPTGSNIDSNIASQGGSNLGSGSGESSQGSRGSGSSGQGSGANSTFTQASGDAQYLRNPKPEYPLIARQRQWGGEVILRVHVTTEGICDQISIERSCGHEMLDKSALEAVKKWRFIPAKRGDTAEASWVFVPIKFEMGSQ